MMRTDMSWRRAVWAATSLAFMLLTGGPVMAGPEDGTAIEERLLQYQTRFNQGDAEALSRLFSPDVVYYDPTGGVHRGREAVAEYYRGSIAAGFSDMEIEVIEVVVDGDSAHDVARYSLDAPGGEPLTGHHLALLAKQDGQWVVTRTLVNAKMPPPQ